MARQLVLILLHLLASHCDYILEMTIHPLPL